MLDPSLILQSCLLLITDRSVDRIIPSQNEKSWSSVPLVSTWRISISLKCSRNIHISCLFHTAKISKHCSWSYTSPPSELSCIIFSKSFLTSGKPSSTFWKSSQDREKHWQSVSAFTVARCLPLVSMHVSVGHTEGTTKAWLMSE